MVVLFDVLQRFSYIALSQPKGSVVAQFSPEGELSCCQLSADGQLLIYGLKDAATLHTLLLCHELVETQAIYGNADNDGKEFEMSKD